MQLVLFVAGSVTVAVAIALPMRVHAVSPTLRRASVHVAIWIGMLAGWLLAQQYQQFLLASHGVPFGTADPVFQKDIGFYVYLLPALRLTLSALALGDPLWRGLAAGRPIRRARFERYPSGSEPDLAVETVPLCPSLLAGSGLRLRHPGGRPHVPRSIRPRAARQREIRCAARRRVSRCRGPLLHPQSGVTHHDRPSPV